MKYCEYLNGFTVSDETKTIIFMKMKQRAKQIESANIQREASKISEPAVPQPKQKKPSRSRIIRWVAISASLAVAVASITPILCFFAFKKPENMRALSLNYMKDLMVNTEGVTAYSIGKPIKNPASKTTAKSKASVSLLSATLINDKAESSDGNDYYLYSTVEDNEDGIEYDANNVEQVVFFKNKEVTDEVYDSNGNLIEKDTAITQDDLDGQINKLYTTKQYTFIQFVAKVKESGEYEVKDENGEIHSERVDLRPSENYFEEGESASQFDKEGYFSSYLTASFVIDNSTGYIYKIENFIIEGFNNGLIYNNTSDVRCYYSISTDSEHNLIFTDICPNKSIEITGAMIDNYGWSFVLNNRLDTEDAENKIIYTTNNFTYYFDSNRDVYTESYNEADVYVSIGKMIDGNRVAYVNRETIRDLEPLGPREPYQLLCGRNEGFHIYKGFDINNISTTGRIIASASGPVSDIYVHDFTKCFWLDNNYDTLIAEDASGLYYKFINLADYRNNNPSVMKETIFEKKDFIYLSDLTFVRKDYTMTIGNNHYNLKNVLCNESPAKTSYYKIVKTETGLELEELSSNAYAENVFVLQPINK